ncbi:hypothetical protein TARUN_3530 [Trichoderma arundinaceum]|uniref:Interferon-induced 6-16 n=1 Tax=Trichoderma arundinaceum TaxID=490622 RepID=A0A395NRX4_TRIAR|nr:hypothetical protein TARUN_3530 [Trichoderma arundinaceum]
MSFIAPIRGGLANAHQGVTKHVNTASINRILQDAQNSMDSTATQINRSITTRNDNRAAEEQQRNIGPDCSHESTAPSPEDARKQATNHTDGETTNADIVGECSSNDTEKGGVTEAAEAVNENPTAVLSSAEDKNGAEGMKVDEEPSNYRFTDGARRLGKSAWENPVLTAATVVTGAGILAVAAPSVVVAPIMGIAGAAGFTPTGIAAYSVASTIHGSIGNVAAGSLFATMQSAAAGGYGLAAVTSAAQAAGGAVAGVGGVVALWKGKQKKTAAEAEQKTKAKVE